MERTKRNNFAMKEYEELTERFISFVSRCTNIIMAKTLKNSKLRNAFTEIITQKCIYTFRLTNDKIYWVKIPVLSMTERKESNDLGEAGRYLVIEHKSQLTQKVIHLKARQ